MSNPYLIASGGSSGTTSLSVAVSTATTASDVIVISAYVASGPPTLVKDSQGNSYILVSSTGVGGFQYVSTGKTRALSTSDTFTINGTPSGVMDVVVEGVPGAAFAGVDVAVVSSGTGATGTLATGALISAWGQIAIPMAHAANSSAVTISGGGFAQLGTVANTTTNPHRVTAGWASLPQGSTTGATFSAALTSAVWGMSCVTLMLYSFVGNAPQPPTQLAGTVAASADENTLAQSALFLRRPPMVIAQANATQAFALLTQAAVTWNVTARDTDGFWNPTANTSRLTVQTPGLYKVRYQVPFAAAANNVVVVVRITTTAANPLGAGTQLCWYGWAGASGISGSVTGGGRLPLPLVAGDYVEILATFTTASATVIAPVGASCSLRMVSF